MSRGFWQRRSWIFLIVLAAVIVLFGVGDIIFAMDADEAIAQGITGMTVAEIETLSGPVAALINVLVRAGGAQLLVLGIVWCTILAIPFRRGERWAWYVMWTFPLWALGVAVHFLFVDLQPDAPTPPPAISGWVFFALCAAVLLAGRPSVDADRPDVP
ncbi:hypothetical protein [Isoptericola croceus]|uniref:hypothetical protein n=1 Tax=Isoptericola croceus TaxID=3031406 RepID=UPI0023F8BFCC|nr:hypothetical protein [Isoptericola croceus]